RTPAAAIWAVAVAALLFMGLVPYTTIAAVCAVFLYISYVLPAAAGFLAHGRTWRENGTVGSRRVVPAINRDCGLVLCGPDRHWHATAEPTGGLDCWRSSAGDGGGLVRLRAGSLQRPAANLPHRGN